MIQFVLSESAKHADERVLKREAVRAVIFRGSRLLMIYSAVAGDYKFPGGGLEEGETRMDALKREVLEECGARVTTVGRQIGEVVEERPAFDEVFDSFLMTSRYYLCMIEEGDFREQNLDDYERDLEFAPRWITGEEAIRINQEILDRGENVPPWTRRETLFLRELVSGE
ncbi:MAG: NUDIX domain-containing protein [Spirochaetales bacterium]|nr:NUDIX domain-containing protein [Spirochaetales bacterium]